jgi:zinc transporter 1
MRGVFLHFMGDALGSIGVIVSAVLNLLLPNESWIVYVDPCASLMITLILVFSAYPLVRSTLSILLQHAPGEVDMSRIRKEILQIPKVLNIHEFHVWQLAQGLFEFNPRSIRRLCSRAYRKPFFRPPKRDNFPHG